MKAKSSLPVSDGTEQLTQALRARTLDALVEAYGPSLSRS